MKVSSESPRWFLTVAMLAFNASTGDSDRSITNGIVNQARKAKIRPGTMHAR